MLRFTLLLLLVVMSVNTAHARTVPDALKPWIEWVTAEERCPQVSGEKNQSICAWPDALLLEQQSTGSKLQFSQRWEVYKPSMIPLPGDVSSWPEDVQLDGVSLPVVTKEGLPFIQLEKGTHRVTGRFGEAVVKGALRLPTGAALVDYRLGSESLFVYLDEKNYAWFSPIGAHTNQHVSPEQDSLSLRVFRKFTDTIPTDVMTTLRLTVSGKKRVVDLGNVLVAGAVPYAINSKLKAGMSDSGKVSVVVQPGVWELTIGAYLPENAEQWKRTKSEPEFWPSTEYWFFQRVPELYRTKVSGAAVVDAKSIDAPKMWSTLAGFAMPLDGRIKVERVARGTNTTGETRASISRDVWLSLSGDDLFIQDVIQGKARPYSSLTVLDDQFKPQSIYLDNEAQVLIRSSEGIGVSLRQKNLNARVLGKQDAARQILLPANPYHELQVEKLSTRLHLPPGWRVLGASDGVLGYTWFSSWTFFQVFLLIIISIAFFRMIGPFWGLFAAVTLGIAFHEPETPIIIWLVLLALIAILRDGLGNYPRLGKWFGIAKSLTLVGIAAMLLVYTVNHIKDSIHPQLNWQVEGQNWQAKTMPVMSSDVVEETAQMNDYSLRVPLAGASLYQSAPSRKVIQKEVAEQHKRENEMPSTSGMPDWQGDVTHLEWPQSALQRTEAVRLYMLSPFLNLVFGFISSLMLIVLFLAAAGVNRKMLRKSIPGIGRKSTLALFIGIVFSTNVQAEEAQFPPQFLLEQLAEEVNRPPVCLPNCATTDRLHLGLTESGELQLRFAISVLEPVAVPLLSVPGTGVEFRAFMHSENEALDLPLRRRGQQLIASLPAGQHEVVLHGAVSADSFQLGLPLSVRQYTETVSGWQPRHVQKNQFWNSLSFKSGKTVLAEKKPENSAGAGISRTRLSGYFSVTRTLELGSGIFIRTEIARLSPPGSVEEVDIAAWPKEVVLTAAGNIKRDSGVIRVRFGSNERKLQFRSSLQFTDEELEAYKGGVLRSLELPLAGEAQLTTWRFDYSGLWNIEVSGLPLIYQQNRNGSNLKMLRPWPAESATLSLSRAAPVPGATVAVKNANFRVTPYQASENGAQGQFELNANIETTRAQTLVLKGDVNFQEVHLNGIQLNSEPGAEVRVPFDAGTFRLTATGELTQGLESSYVVPQIAVETQSGENVELFNMTSEIEMPRDRWVFNASGSGVGPDFLFWSILPTLILVAIGLHFLQLGNLGGAGWFLLMIGFTQANSFGLYFGLGMSTLFIGWLFLLRKREAMQPFEMGRFRFNAFQVFLIILSVAVLISMANGLYSGLLGSPKMQVAGNGSNAYFLRWFSDQGMPQASVNSLPVLFYRIGLLIWEIWLSFVVIGWVKYAWKTFAGDVMFRAAPDVATVSNAAVVSTGRVTPASAEVAEKGKRNGLVLAAVVIALLVAYVFLGRIF